MDVVPTTVGGLAARSPAAIRVLSRHDIDFCCGGDRPLGEACRGAGLPVQALLDEVEAEEAAHGGPDQGWAERPLPALVEHILQTFHAPLRPELARLDRLARTVARVHAAHDGERLAELVRVFADLAADLEAHMAKEEQVLFPWILAGRGASAGHPIRVMQDEHEHAGQALARIRALTDHFTPPEDACMSWRALLEGLAAFDAALREHIHLENNVLFPRALVA